LSTYFDTSALVAAMVEEEEHHIAALKALASSRDAFTSTHAIAETFATLTSGRLEVQLTPAEAALVIDANVIRRLQIVHLGLSDYERAMRNSQTVGARGGAIFDMLHLQAARRGAAKRILTIHVRHFQIFAPDLKSIISLP
jgi:predicted nucleic acid-binding protein